MTITDRERAQKLAHLEDVLTGHLEEIRDLFERPDEVRLTLVVRTPWLAAGGVFFTDDTHEAVIAEIERLRAR